MAEDPLRPWTDVPEWSGEIECMLSDNHPILNLSGTDTVGAYHMRGFYRIGVRLIPLTNSWFGEGDATGSWVERSEVDTSGFGFTQFSRETVFGGGSGTEIVSLTIGTDPNTNRSSYSFRATPLRIGVQTNIYHLTHSGFESEPPTEVDEAFPGRRLLSVPRVEADLPAAVRTLSGTRTIALAGSSTATVSWRFEPANGPATEPTTPCGATIRVLDFQNQPIDTSMALSVSNHVADDNALGQALGFASRALDRDAFRLEVEDPSVSNSFVEVAMGVGGRFPTIYQLDQRSGSRYRGPFLRLVTDAFDAAALGNSRNILCKLNDEVVIRYSNSVQATCEDRRRIRIGRPSSEDNNDHPNHLRHDIRLLALHVVVFSKPTSAALVGDLDRTRTIIKVGNVDDAQDSGLLQIGDEVIRYSGRLIHTAEFHSGEFTGCIRGAEGTVAAEHSDGDTVMFSSRTPAVTRAQVDDDLNTVDERFAQSGIRVRRPCWVDLGPEGDTGVALPLAMLSGFTCTGGGELVHPTAAETAIVAFKDADVNTVDVFYVAPWVVVDDGTLLRAIAFPLYKNQTGDIAFQNFTVLSEHRGPLTLGHELLHILLNATHRLDHDTALFYAPTGDNKEVHSTKRIGPFPDAEATGVGVRDTEVIRTNVESLPS